MATWETVRHQVAIAGRVVDGRTARPLRGARVDIATGPGAFTELLGLHAKQHGSRWEGMMERVDRTRAAPDGHFHFLDLPDGSYVLAASMPLAGTRYAPVQAGVVVSRANGGTITMGVAEISLAPTAVSGRITDEAGAPVVMAEVQVQASGEHTFTDTHGAYRLIGLEAGARFIRVMAPGYLPAVQAALLTQPGDLRVLDVLLLPQSFAPTQIAGCKLWLRSDAIVGLTDNQPVALWPDRSGSGHDATQETPDKRPRFKTAAFNGKPALRFDGSDDALSLPLTEASTDHTFFFVYQHSPSGGHSNYLFDAQTGRLALDGADASAPYAVRWNDGNWHTVAEAVPGKAIMTWLFSGTTAEVFRNGMGLGAAPYAPRPLGGSVSLGANYLGSQSNFEGELAEVLYYNRALPEAERRRVERYLSNRYAIPVA